MPITRVITDIPPERVDFVVAMIRADNGRVVSRQLEDDGEVTIVAEFPDAGASGSASADAVLSAPAPSTATAAPSGTAHAAAAPWMAVAQRELDAGIAEVSGAADSPRIQAYHATTHGVSAGDAVAWCSSFVNFCIREAGLHGTDSRRARSWLAWGQPAAGMTPGCIVVLERGKAPKGHVGFYVGTDSGRVRLLGGNQGNGVSIASFDAHRVIGMRLPD